jgi:hypothetical protein
MPRPTRRWSFLLGAFLAVAGLAFMAKPLVAGTPAGSSPRAVASDADCCRNDRSPVDFDPAPALGMLGVGGVLMLAAAIAVGTPAGRRLA